MKSLSYTSLLISFILLYYFTATAYNRVIKIEQVDILPVFYKQKCIITHLELQQNNNLVDDLNIYYSGVQQADNKPHQLTLNQESQIQEEMTKAVRTKQNTQVNIEPKKEEKKAIIDKKPVKNITESKTDINKIIKNQEEDAFSVNKKYKSVEKKQKNQTKTNVFDVIE
jgi:hypothetical protein